MAPLSLYTPALTIVMILFCLHCRTETAIPSHVQLHRVAAAADRQAIINLAADHPLIQKHAPDHCLAHRVAMAASTRAVLDIHTPGHAQGLVHIQPIIDVAIAAILAVLVQDAADM